jgi:hypothetical protein
MNEENGLRGGKYEELSLLNKENHFLLLRVIQEDLVQEAFHLNVMMLTSIKSVVIKAHLNRI